ncbi:MAG: alpha/beta hydrolase [Chloroflexi bacterium]|nr:alpha/beta hydrolase [Chloroflexota bacterium]
MDMVPVSEARCTFVSANGLRLRCWQLGGQGRPVVLLHGYTSTAWRTWQHVAPWLATRYRTYWYDMRGHGESDKPPTGYAHTDYAADARALCAALGLERPIFAGHSLGGATVLTLAIETPGLPAAIIPIDPPLWREGGQPAERTRFTDTLDLKFLSPAALVASQREQSQGLSDSELADLLVGRAQVGVSALVETWRAGSGIDMLAPLAGQVTKPYDLITPLTRITCPTLLVRGAETSGNAIPGIIPADVFERALATLPNGRGLSVAGVGHQVPQEKPAETAAAMLAFLDALG